MRYLCLLTALAACGSAGTMADRDGDPDRHQPYERQYAETFSDTERYAPVDESRFRATADQPLSTFAVDVDTASYGNVRRFLNAGTLPPLDAVRVEELLNYFPYADVAAAPGHPLAIATEVAPCPWADGHLLARVRVAAPRDHAAEAAPKNLVFLVDVSGSMRDELWLVRRTIGGFVKKMRARDSVGIVVYAGRAGVLLEPTADRDDIADALDALDASGSTAGAAGITAAYALAREHFIRGGINRVVLATDGDFNVGPSSDSELVRLVEREKEDGIFLTVLGFGTGNFNDQMLRQISVRGDGNFFYIDSEREAYKVLVDGALANFVTIARDVKVQLALNPDAVERYRLIGYEDRRLAPEDFADDLADGGEIGSGHTVTALYELVPTRAATAELFTVSVRYQPPSGGVSQIITQPARAVVTASDDFRLAAGVAAFALVLRDSPHRGAATYESARALVASTLDHDPGQLRRELVTLIERAATLARQAQR